MNDKNSVKSMLFEDLQLKPPAIKKSKKEEDAEYQKNHGSKCSRCGDSGHTSGSCIRSPRPKI